MSDHETKNEFGEAAEGQAGGAGAGKKKKLIIIAALAVLVIGGGKPFDEGLEQGRFL